MKNRYKLQVRSIAALLLVAGCQPWPQPRLVPGNEAAADASREAVSMPRVESEVGAGAGAGSAAAAAADGVSASETVAVANPPADWTAVLEVRVVWPERSLQVLPASATEVEVTVSTLANVQLAKPLKLTRGQQATAGKIERLPAATLKISAVAKNAAGAVVASGTRQATLEGNKRNAVSLSLIPALMPVITGFSPKAGGPGTSISISGSNFGDAQNPFSLKLGGIAISQSYLDNGTIYATVPSNATTSLFVVTVDGVSSDSVQLFTPVASLDLAAGGSLTMSSGSSLVFTVTAKDTAQAPQPVREAPIAWSLANVNTGTTGGLLPVSPQLGSFSEASASTGVDGKGTAKFTATATGSGWVQVGCGPILKATLSVQVQ
jgi:hypothetical protein